MTDKFLQGQRTWTVGRLHCAETGRRDYHIKFRRNEKDIARLYYHSDAEQIVLRIDDEVVLTKETIEALLPVMNMDRFRTMRRFGQSRIRVFIAKARMESAK